MRKIPLVVLGLLALPSCAENTLPDASLRLSPGSVTLKRGESTNVTAYFKKYVFEGDPDSYFLSVLPSSDRGVRVTTFDTTLSAEDSTFFRVEAASNAETGRHDLTVFVHDNDRNVTEHLTVTVTP